MQHCDNSKLKPMFILTHEQVLEEIKDMLDEYRGAMKTKDSCTDYLDGGMSSLKELAVRLGLCEYEALMD